MHVSWCVCVCKYYWGQACLGFERRKARTHAHTHAHQEVEPLINFSPGFIITWMIKVGGLWRGSVSGWWGTVRSAVLMEELSDSSDWHAAFHITAVRLLLVGFCVQSRPSLDFTFSFKVRWVGMIDGIRSLWRIRCNIHYFLSTERS